MRGRRMTDYSEETARVGGVLLKAARYQGWGILSKQT